MQTCVYRANVLVSCKRACIVQNCLIVVVEVNPPGFYVDKSKNEWSSLYYR